MMTRHVHMIIGKNGEKTLDEILRDMKSFTSQTYHKLIGDTMKVHESRKLWMLDLMKSSHNKKGRTDHFQFWQHHNKPIEIWSPDVVRFYVLDYCVYVEKNDLVIDVSRIY